MTAAATAAGRRSGGSHELGGSSADEPPHTVGAATMRGVLSEGARPSAYGQAARPAGTENVCSIPLPAGSGTSAIHA